MHARLSEAYCLDAPWAAWGKHKDSNSLVLFAMKHIFDFCVCDELCNPLGLWKTHPLFLPSTLELPGTRVPTVRAVG